MHTTDLSEDELKLLYLDWCSTRVARRFLELSEDEVWVRSNAAALLADSSEPLGSLRKSFLPLDRIPAYLELVRNTTLLLAQEMKLPSFPEWYAAYSENPQEFLSEVMGR